MAGLVPAIHVLQDGLVKIVPVRVLNNDLANLPSARPMLDRLFALDCIADIIENFKIDELLETISLGKARHRPDSMFMDTAHQICGDANVQDAIRLAGN